LVLGSLALFALPMAAGRAQTATSSGDIIEKLAVEAESDIDLAALKQPAADRASTDKTTANPFRRRVRPGLLPDPAGLLPDDRQHRRRIERSEIAALPLSDRRSCRIRRPARPQSDREPAARRIDPGCAGEHLQGVAEAASGPWSRRGTVAGCQPSGC